MITSNVQKILLYKVKYVSTIIHYIYIYIYTTVEQNNLTRKCNVTCNLNRCTTYRENYILNRMFAIYKIYKFSVN